MTETKAAKNDYKTLTDVLNAPARESMATVARIAPAIERIARESGILSLVFSPEVMAAYDPARVREMTLDQRKSLNASMLKLGEEAMLRILKYGLGECLGDMQEIVAAVNGITKDELLDDYSGVEVVAMAKAIVSDQGFLTSLKQFID